MRVIRHTGIYTPICSIAHTNAVDDEGWPRKLKLSVEALSHSAYANPELTEGQYDHVVLMNSMFVTPNFGTPRLRSAQLRARAIWTIHMKHS